MPKRILVVDDDEDISLMLKDRLTFLGFHVTTAGDGAEGMTILEKMAIDGILLDLQMPVMDGLTMLEHLREQYPSMPVIVMTADANTGMLIQAMENQANDYVTKPIDVDLLEKKCLNLVS